MSYLGFLFKISKTCLLGRDLHTFIKNVLFPYPTNVSLGPSVLTDTRSSLQSMWDFTIHSPSGPNVFVDTPSGVHPFGAQCLHWHTASDTICKSLSPRKLWDPTPVVEGNKTFFFIKVWKLISSRRIIKTFPKKSKHVSASDSCYIIKPNLKF